MIEAVITKGENQSNVIELKGRLCGINNLIGWTTQQVFLLGSHDNKDFFHISNVEGKTLSFRTYPGSNRGVDFFVTIDPSYNGLEGVKYIKFITQFKRVEKEERRIRLTVV